MALTEDQIKESYPLPAYSYKVRIGAETYGFQQVSGLRMQYDTMTYRHGLSPVEGPAHMPGLPQAINLSLQRGIVRQGSILLQWIMSIRLDKVLKQDIIIDLCNEKGAPVVSWKVIDAFPTGLDAPSFDAGANQVAVETLNLMATSVAVSYHQTA